MVIRWDSESDWKSSQDSSGTTGRNGELKQGYSRERPELITGLIGYWPLHDNSATDYSGNNNHGSLNGGVTTGVAGKGGLKAMSFDGSDDWVDIPDQLLSNGSSLTLSFWFKADTLGSDNRPVAISQSHECLANIGRSGSNEIGVRWRPEDGNANDYGFKQISSNQWYHYVVTYDSSSGDLKGYLDATEQLNKSGIGSSGIDQSSAIGQKGGTGYYNGKISEIRLYSRALTPSEVQNLYDWGSNDYARPPTDSLTAHYKLDGDATDSSGNNNDGTENGNLVYSDDAIRGQSGDFAASESDYIEATGLSPNPPHSFSLWVKFDDASRNDSIFSIRTNSSTPEVQLYKDADNWKYYDGSQNTFPGSPTVSTGVWYHIVYVGESLTSGRFYINGTHISNISPSFESDSADLRLGVDGENEAAFLDGHIDDVRIYDRALKPFEIFELYRYGTRGRDMRKQLVNY